MIKNYLKTAWRNLAKYKVFSTINIMGLAIGMAACLLILQYVSFKLSFDQFNPNVKDIYRVANDRYQSGKLIQHGTITYSAIGRAMDDDYEEVINHTRVVPNGGAILTYNDKKIPEADVFFAENSLFKIFNYPLVAGDTATVLEQPYTVLVSETLARKLFDIKNGDYQQAMGKTVKVGTDSMPFQVQGVLKDVPQNSHLQFQMLLSYGTLISNGWKEAEYNFTTSDFWHYVQLRPGTDHKSLNAKLPAFSKRHFDGNKVSGSDEKFFLQPLSRAHLYSDFEYEIGETGSSTVVWGLLIIALFIITIAWVNYINLATARAAERAKEVGMRKVMGGLRKQLMGQFMMESTIINFFGIVLALGLVFLLQSSFNKLLGYQLSLSYLFTKGLNGYMILISLVAIVVAGIFVSGIYPALVLSSFKPIAVLKGKFSHSKKGILLRKGLVIGQFSVTVALIIGSIVVMDQLRYMSNKELGFNMDQVMVINPPNLTPFDSTFMDHMNAFKEDLKQLAAVKGATTSWNVPGGETGRSFNVRQADSATTNRFTMRHTSVDYDFLSVYGIKLVAGRNFTRADHNPRGEKLQNVMINKNAAALLGFSSPEAAIGRDILRGQRKWTIVGVINDYHQKSLRFPMEPMLIMPFYSTNSSISVKLNTSDLSNTITAIKKKYESFFPGNLFDYVFLDERFNRQYQTDQLFGKVFTIFAGLAIFVACLGLFGLALFATLQRTKEIGIRKVLGASVSNILLLLSKDFVKLVAIASLIAFPLAWYVMNQWLQDFTYRVGISWWIFVIAGGAALIVALVTISIQAIKAALANPVKSLRSE
jgi:putative ABC transport system permease protein